MFLVQIDSEKVPSTWSVHKRIINGSWLAESGLNWPRSVLFYQETRVFLFWDMD